MASNDQTPSAILFEGAHEMAADEAFFLEGEHSQARPDSGGNGNPMLQRGVYSEVLRAHDDTDVL